jgi:hypothetical protein
LDDIREQSFTKIKKRKVWTKGRMVKQVHSIEEIIRARFGSEELLRPGDIPACVLCAAQQHEDGKNGKKTIEPFVLRTYNYPPSSNGEAEAYMQDVNVREKHFTEEQVERGVVNSCSSATLAEAMAATTAVPMVYKPVKVNLKGEQLDFADGVIFNESPVAIAISEARRLYPNRPLGVIMSIGLTSSTHAEEYTRRAIDIARQSHPNLYFHRIIPHEIIDKFHYLETDPDKVASFEEALRHFLHTNVATNDLLDNTIDKLFASNHHSHETTRKQEPSLSRMPSNSSTSTTRMFSTSSSIQSQNMVCDLNGWQGYEEQEDPDEMEEPSSIINVLLCCFRKKDNKQVPDTPGIQAQGITKDTKEEVSLDTTIKETNSFSPSEVSCGEQSDADSLSNDACLSVISLDDRFDHETWNDEA